MKKDFDDEDLEELDDDDYDGVSDFDDFDEDDDFNDDDLKELEEEGDDSPVTANAVSASSEEEWEELDDDDFVSAAADPVPLPIEEELEELAEEETEGAFKFETKEILSPPPEAEDDDDASFFDEVVDEGNDLGLELPAEDAGKVAIVVATPRVGAVTQESGAAHVTGRATETAARGLQPVLFALPALGILLGAGYYFLKSGENFSTSSPPVISENVTGGETHSGHAEKVPFIKPIVDTTIPTDYVELKKMNLSDHSKIESLTNAGLLKKKMNASTPSIKNLTLILYKTAVRYVVSQTYHYIDGSKWTVESQFSEHESAEEEVIKAFDSVYSG